MILSIISFICCFITLIICFVVFGADKDREIIKTIYEFDGILPQNLSDEDLQYMYSVANNQMLECMQEVRARGFEY